MASLIDNVISLDYCYTCGIRWNMRFFFSKVLFISGESNLVDDVWHARNKLYITAHDVTMLLFRRNLQGVRRQKCDDN